MTQIVQLALANDFAAARENSPEVFPADGSEFRGNESRPRESALALMGLLDPVFRLPLVAPKPENLAKIRSALEAVGLVQEAYAAN